MNNITCQRTREAPSAHCTCTGRTRLTDRVLHSSLSAPPLLLLALLLLLLLLQLSSALRPAGTTSMGGGVLTAPQLTALMAL
jgi:hypothetical protein